MGASFALYSYSKFLLLEANPCRLIAIMLGRLEMDVDECINAYTDFMEDIFSKPLHKVKVGANGKIQARFDSEAMKQAIEKVIRAKDASPTDPFNDGRDRGCHV